MDCHAGRPDGERDRRNQSVASFLSSFFFFFNSPFAFNPCTQLLVKYPIYNYTSHSKQPLLASCFSCYSAQEDTTPASSPLPSPHFLFSPLIRASQHHDRFSVRR